MTSNRSFLRNALAEESRAYGFTIAFWGSGALLVKNSGLPGLTEAMLYGLGGLTGFGLLILFVYRSAFDQHESEEPQLLVLSMIHYVGALIPILVASYTSKISDPANFFITGLSVSILYNLGMLVEEIFSERAMRNRM